jgi:hypothetical protein
MFFIVYFAVKSIMDISFIGINGEMFRDINIYGIRHIGVSPAVIFTSVILVDIILFTVGLWLFTYLLRKRIWARVILLIGGWLVVFDAVSGMLMHAHTIGILNQLSSGTDWNRIMLIDRLTDILGLIYYGYMITILQFNGGVKQLFMLSPEGPPQG